MAMQNPARPAVFAFTKGTSVWFFFLPPEYGTPRMVTTLWEHPRWPQPQQALTARAAWKLQAHSGLPAASWAPGSCTMPLGSELVECRFVSCMITEISMSLGNGLDKLAGGVLCTTDLCHTQRCDGKLYVSAFVRGVWLCLAELCGGFIILGRVTSRPSLSALALDSLWSGDLFVANVGGCV